MRNYIIAACLIVLTIFSFATEPFPDTIDALAGATNTTYGPSPDSVAGASYEDDDEEEDDDHDEHEEDD